MAGQPLPVADQVRQLQGARKLVLGDVTYYPQVIQATLPIIGPTAHLELRRWGAEFWAETFATPAIPLSQKETLSLLVLETLKVLVEDPFQDVVVLRGVIQTAASVYPLALRWIINNAYDTTTWSHITAIKTRVLRIWESAQPNVRVCCVKFAQRVVLAQTPSINAEPRRGDPLDISLGMIQPGHTILDAHSLEAEASGLLDRTLAVLQNNSSDALVVDATLNSLSILVRARPSTSNRILNAVLSFNPLKLANTPMTAKTKVLVRSMEKTTRMLLMHISRRDPRNPQIARIHQYIERLVQQRNEIFDGVSRKRAHAEQADGADTKRQRLAPAQPELQIPPLKAGAITLADIFTLSQHEGLKTFDVSLVPAPLAIQISVNTLARLDPRVLQMAVNGVHDRLKRLRDAAAQPLNPETAALDVEDDDEYEPDYAMEDTEQVQNRMETEPPSQAREMEKTAVLGSLALPAFKLPPPPALSSGQAAKLGQGAVARVFGAMKALDDLSTKRIKAGLNRLAASSHDRDAWTTILTRLVTRAEAGLSDVSVKNEQTPKLSRGFSLSDTIRDKLFTYIMEDFRKRFDVAIAWLSEEWYNDRIQMKNETAAVAAEALIHYQKWAVRLVLGFLPYLHAQDKFFIRFLGEIPEINVAMLASIKDLCRDPSMVSVALHCLQYLIMMRPPVREIALDAVQDAWIEFEEARPKAGELLRKWRPGFVESQSVQSSDNDGVEVETPVGQNGPAAVAT